VLARSKAALIALLLAGCGDADVRLARDALGEGDLRAAEAAARRGESPVHTFLLGNVAFARCEMAEKQAGTPAAEPFAWDVAITYCRKAIEFWSVAAMSLDDWPAARRNVERALLKLEELRQKKEEADVRRRKQAKPQPRPRPLPRPKGDAETDSPDKPQLRELTPEQVLKLLDKLAQKEQEKLALRRSHRKTRTAGVERDW